MICSFPRQPRGELRFSNGGASGELSTRHKWLSGCPGFNLGSFVSFGHKYQNLTSTRRLWLGSTAQVEPPLYKPLVSDRVEDVVSQEVKHTVL